MSNGTMSFLKESMMERADGCTFTIDADNGNITSSLKGVDNVGRINVPYAVKALMYEVNTLGINPMLIT
jgi:DNA-directed RNA polymerase beta subunit